MTGAINFAEGLFLLSEERGNTEKVHADVEAVASVLRGEPDYIRLLDTPAVPTDEKLGLIGQAFADADPDVCSLLKILCGSRKTYLFPAVAEEYSALYDDKRGILRVEAITAVPMQEAQLDRLGKKIETMTGKTVCIRNKVEPQILGGVRLRYAGRQIDSSVRTRLDSLEKAILGEAL